MNKNLPRTLLWAVLFLLINFNSFAQNQSVLTTKQSQSNPKAKAPAKPSDLIRKPLKKMAIQSHDLTRRTIIEQVSTKSNPVKLYGFMAYSTGWGWDTWENIDFGMYSFYENSYSSIESLHIDESMYIYSGVYYEGYYYASGPESWHIYDASTWDEIETLDVSELSGARDMTYDLVTGNVYGITYNGFDEVYNYLSTIDMNTGKATRIGKTDVYLATIAADLKGNLYGVATDGYLYRVNKETAACTAIGNTGFSIDYFQSATFDLNTGNLYWSANFSDGSTALCKVDTTDGSASVLMYFDNYEEFLGLYSLVPDDAPAKVTDLALNFESPALGAGKVTCTAPSTTFAGNNLSGTLNIALNINGDSVITETLVTPGSAFTSKDLNFSNGLNYVIAYASNDDGTSLPNRLTFWVGYDNPAEVQNLTLTRTEEGKGFINWSKPTIGSHKGYIDTLNLTYDVLRLPDSVYITKATTDTFVYDLSIGSELGAYKYAVTAISQGMAGTTTLSNIVALGDAATVPFTETFDEDAFTYNLWTVIDNNGETGWEYYDGVAIYNNVFGSVSFNNEYRGDDWLISPPIQLNAAYAYKWSHTARILSSMTESYSLTMGTAANAASQTTILADYPEFYSPEAELTDTVERIVTVPTDGKYYFGFYEYSEPNHWALVIDNISLTQWVKVTAPDSVQNLTAIAASAGVAEAVISFTAPSEAFNGESLSSISTIVIYRNDSEQPVYTFENPTVGASLSWTDDNPINGFNSYKVVASNSEGDGPDVTVTIFVGKDNPKPVSSLAIETNESGNPVLNWSLETTGVNEGYIDVDGMNFMVIRNDTDTLSNKLTTYSYIDESINNTSDQILVYYTVVPYYDNFAGESATTESIVVGKAYELPFYESFANAITTTSVWQNKWVEGSDYATWTIYDYGVDPDADPQDDDGGLVYFNSYDVYSTSSAMLITPSISLSGSDHPVFSFWVYHLENNYDDYMKALISTDGISFTELNGGEIHLADKATGWAQYSFMLNDYANASKVYLALQGISNYGYNISVDNISVTQAPDNDYELVSLEGKTYVEPNSDVDYTVTVKNVGVEAFDDYSVKLVSNNDTIAEINGTSISSFETTTFNFTVSYSIVDAGNSFNLKAVLVSGTDENSENNVSDILTTYVETSTFNTPNTLTGVLNGNDIELSWTAPTETSDETYDGFEYYESFTIDNFGDWTMIDGDESSTYSISADYDNANSPAAFQVFCTSEAGINNDAINPYQGKKELFCFNAVNPPNNDWLISPILTGDAQTISFYAKSATDEYGMERLTVYYSTSGTETSDFIKISEGDYMEIPASWTKYTFTLPEGAIYFALQCTSNDAFILMLDAFTFTVTPPEFVGYNVYRNDEMINSTIVTSNSYTDAKLEDGTYTYQVSAIYDKGESGLSNSVTISVGETSIDDNNSKIKVYDANQDIVIEGVNNARVLIISVDGKLICQKQVNNTERIHVAKGVYVVSIDRTSYKVIVN